MNLRVENLQGISWAKWIECTCGLAARRALTKWLQCTCRLTARRAFQGPNGLNVPAGWQPAGHFKDQMDRMYLRVGSPQGISRTKWLECTCGLAARRAFQGPNGLNVHVGWQPRRAFQGPNGLNVPAGWQPAGHFKDQMA